MCYKNGFKCHIRTENNKFKALYVHSRTMDEVLLAFPEILCFDGTYSLFILNYTLVLNMCIDGNGKSELCGSFIIAEET